MTALIQTSSWTTGFLPHGYCYLWNKPLLWTHLIADILIGLSYVTISCSLVVLMHRVRREIPFSSMFIAFGTFIIACGMTHFMEVWTLWRPDYWLAGGVKVVTAIASVTTAVIMPFLVPRIQATIYEAKQSRSREQAAERAAELEEQVRRRTTELRVALSAAEEANRAKSAFLARMSHELRTPLNSIIGFANVLRKNKSENLRPKDLEYADRIGTNGRHLLSLINSILDLAKIESGHMDAEIVEVTLATLVTEVVAQLEGVTRDRPVDLRIDMPSRIAPVATDETKMRQILMNLIGNALKFTEVGSITVRVVTNPMDARPQRIDVIDTGIGIPADRLETVFRPFEQADTSTTRKYGGTGLGLAITRSMCELLGAQLTVSSTVGEGSTFSILLSTPSITGDASHNDASRIAAPESHTASGTVPSDVSTERGIPARLVGDVAPASIAVDTAPVASPGAPPVETRVAARSLEERVVLMIDDDPDARTVLSHYIAGTGCRVLTAASGAEGLRLAAAHRPDIITLDLMMPDMNGWEVLRRLKSDPELEHIPVVVVSVVADDSQGSVFGAVDLLDKPCTREALLTTLRRNLQPMPTRVLLVEDDRDTRDVMLYHLHEYQNIETYTADTGVTALQMLATCTPHLILLDVMMPTMDGATFLTHLRNDPRYAHIPVVIVTAKDLTAEERDRLTAHALRIVYKGEDLEAALHRTLEQVMGRLTRAAHPAI